MSNLILDQVVALIEPLTRFDRNSVQLRDASEQTLSCKGVWASAIAISSSIADGMGKLPSGVRDAGSQSGMERAIEEALAAERSNVARRIQGWCDRQAQSPPATHKPLTSGDCISGITRIGYAWKCSSCHGQGKITCTACYGARQVKCLQCSGSGRLDCPACHGENTRACSSCGGQGRRYEQVPIRYWNDATNQYSVRYESKLENCQAVGCRNGRVSCICAGGKVNCGHCLGGKIMCSTCNALGEETCKPCNGVGTLHRVAETACDVRNTFAIHSGDFNDEDTQTTANWDFQTFCQLASPTSQAPDITALRLCRTYPATLSRTQAHIECAGQKLLLVGYGTEARVFNFKGIVGHLLTNDLQQLRSTLDLPLGFLPFRNQGPLRTALATMLQSELNQQIANPQQRAALIASRTVTEEHAATTANSLRKAMSRLYSSTAAISLAAIFAVSYLTMYLLTWSGYLLPQNRPIGVAAFLAVATVTIVATEFVSRYFFLKGFSSSDNAECREAAGRLLRAAGTPRRWRIAAVVTIVVAMISFLSVTL